MLAKGFLSSCQISKYPHCVALHSLTGALTLRFAGDPAPNTVTNINNDSEPTGSDSSPSLIEKVKLGIAETAKSFRIDMWLARQTPEKVLPILRKVIAGVKEEFADAVANGGGVYAVGYCFGGKYVLLLGSELRDVDHRRAVQDEERGATLSSPLIKAGAVAHGKLRASQSRIMHANGL